MNFEPTSPETGNQRGIDNHESRPTSPEPLLLWPQPGTIHQETLAALAPGNWSHEGRDAPVNPDAVQQLAPDLRQAIHNAAADYQPSDFLLQVLSYELNSLVREIADRIPQEQKDNLTRAINAADTAASP